MGENALLRLKNGLKCLQKSVCLLENCLFEPFLGVKSHYCPVKSAADQLKALPSLGLRAIFDSDDFKRR